MKPILKLRALHSPTALVSMGLLLSTFLAQMAAHANASVFLSLSTLCQSSVTHAPSVAPDSIKSTETSTVRLAAQTNLAGQQTQASWDATRHLLSLWTNRKSYMGYGSLMPRSDDDEIRRALNVSSVSADIAAEADANARSKGGQTVLMEAADMGKLDVVKVLIRAHADVDAKDDLGETALDFAAYDGYTSIVKALIDAHADFQVRRRGQTALMWAAESLYATAAKVLIDAHANVYAESDTGATALMLAASFRNDAAAKVLIDAHANVNARDKNGTTALMSAAQFGDVPLVKVLIRAGADVNARRIDGMTVLDNAEVADFQKTASERSAIIAVLKAAGAK